MRPRRGGVTLAGDPALREGAGGRGRVGGGRGARSGVLGLGPAPTSAERVRASGARVEGDRARTRKASEPAGPGEEATRRGGS